MTKFFPIRTDTACQLKWNWSTLYLHEGKTASCHRTGWSKLTPENFVDFHNTERKQQERQSMLKGQWPKDSCQYCSDIEKTGGFSDRLLHLDIPDMYPLELDQDPTALVVTPTILEVYFNNTCNLSCVYCTPNLSSKINQENIKFGDWEYQDLKLRSIPITSDYEKTLEKFWSWMDENSHKLKRFNVLGGEPFYQLEYFKLLQYFEDRPHPNLELGIVTNLMISSDKLDAMIERWKSLLKKRHLKRIDVTCSIDCWGTEQTYVRHGLDLKTWQTNFEKLLGFKWLKINVNQTISVLTIKTMPALLKNLQVWRQQHEIGHYFSEVSPGPSHLKPNILGAIFDQDFEQILSLMPADSQQDRNAISYMKGISEHVSSSTKNIAESDKLQKYLDEIDRRRGTDWKQTFPWLAKEIEHVV